MGLFKYYRFEPLKHQASRWIRVILFCAIYRHHLETRPERAKTEEVVSFQRHCQPQQRITSHKLFFNPAITRTH